MRCSLTVDSSDARFWQATITDGYYTCNNDADPSNLCKDSGDEYYQETQEASSDWSVPQADDNPADPWCTTDAVVGEAVKPYACTQIRCIVERAFDTGDTVKDFKITPTV